MTKVGATEVETPECDRMLAVHDRSQAIGEFLDWLSEQGVRRMRFEEVADSRLCPNLRCDNGTIRRGLGVGTCDECEGEGVVEVAVERWVPEPRSIQELLADYFEIDLVKVDTERRAILEALQAGQ